MWFVNNPALDRWAIVAERGLYYYGWLPGNTTPVPLGIWNPAQVRSEERRVGKEC